jgi:hypothetical protein
MIAPTLVSYAETASWVTAGTSKTATISWSPGDYLAYIALSEGPDTLAVPTGTGLTFVSRRSNVAAGSCAAQLAVCQPQTSGSSVLVTGTNSSATSHWGFGVWVFRSSLGGGASIEQHTATQTVALTPSTANCAVIWGVGDFSAGAPATLTPTPSNTREATQSAGRYTAYAADLTDQTSGGSTSYGLSGAGSGPFTIVVLEIMSTPEGRTGGRYDDRFRFRSSQLWSGTSTLGTKRSSWCEDARDFGLRDSVADTVSRLN